MTLGRSRVIALALAVVAAGVTALMLRGGDDPAERIKQKVIEMARAAEKKDVSFVLEQVSPRFRSAEGWSKDELKSVLAMQILRGTWVRVFVVGLEVSMTGTGSADFKGKFVFGRSAAEELKDLPRDSSFQGYAIEGKLELEGDGEWRFVSARHRVMEPTELF